MSQKEKQKLLQSEFGQELQDTLKRYCKLIYRNSFNVEEIDYRALLDIYILALNFIFNENFDIQFSEDYYGIYATIAGEYLIKEPVEKLWK